MVSKAVVLKGQGGGVRRVHLPLDPHRFSVHHLPNNHRLALQRSLSKAIWKGRRPMVRRQLCCQRPRNRGLGMPDLGNQWFIERLAYLGRSLSKDTEWRGKVCDTFPRLESGTKPEVRR